MYKLHDQKSKNKRKSRKRVGRGSGSGTGTYSGRGLKGQKARSGGNIKPGFEGGRMPFIRQMPKNRGFKSHHPENQVVNLADLEKVFDNGDKVNPKTLQKKNLIDEPRMPIKILGSGSLNKKLEVAGVQISKTAEKVIQDAGGTIASADDKQAKKEEKKS